MTKITINEHELDIPQSWDECTDSQALGIATLAMRDSTVNRFVAFKRLLPNHLRHMVHSFSAEQAADIVKLMGWAFSTFPTRPINWEPVAPKWWKFWKKPAEARYMPDAQGTTLVAIEFHFAETLFRNIGNSPAALAKFVAVLVRPQKRRYDPLAHDYDGDRRHRFNPALIDVQAEQILEHLPTNYLCYVYLWFLGLKSYLANMYQPLFHAPEEGEEKRQKHNTIPDFGWLGVIFDLAAEGTFGNEEQTQYAYLHNVFTYLCKRYYDRIPPEQLSAAQ